MNSESVTIYGLSDPADPDVIRYVGKTRYLQRRLRLHMSEARRDGHTHKVDWLRSLNGATPRVIIIAVVDGATADFTERLSILTLRMITTKLTNGTSGGDGAYILPDWVRRKISTGRAGKKTGPLSAERRAQISACHRGRKRPQSAIEKTRARMTGSRLSATTRAKISATLSGRVNGPMPEETRAKIAAKAHARGPRPAELKQRLSAALLGRPQSQETRDKRSATMRARWARYKEVGSWGR